MVFMGAILHSADAAITVEATAFWNSENDTSGTDSIVTNNFDASGYDKLVVVVTGENGNPGNLTGNVSSVTYDGVSLTEVVDRNPIDNSGSPTPLGATIDQNYNSIFYIDNPLTSTGLITVNCSSYANVTVFGLNGTAAGVGNTIIGAQEDRSIDLMNSAGSIVIASLGMGGNGNTANVTSVNTVDPTNFIEVSAQERGSNWSGHVTGYRIQGTAGTNSYEFTGGNIIGSHVIAAEFSAIPEPSAALLGVMGSLMLLRRRR